MNVELKLMFNFDWIELAIVDVQRGSVVVINYRKTIQETAVEE